MPEKAGGWRVAFSIVKRRFVGFGREAVMLWHAFWNPATPGGLKFATALAGLYLVSPVDLVPGIVPVLGVVDDLIIVPLMVSQISKRLPEPVRERAGAKADRFMRRWMKRPLLLLFLILMGFVAIWALVLFLLYRLLFGG
ncbi:MAG: hypothetical protein B7X53_14395 [Hyphomonas sp. 34-62-18]|nr:MAG: hypothetical protein B7X53_14395 [Hyphomonas sp. 34-62-18]